MDLHLNSSFQTYQLLKALYTHSHKITDDLLITGRLLYLLQHGRLVALSEGGTSAFITPLTGAIFALELRCICVMLDFSDI